MAFDTVSISSSDDDVPLKALESTHDDDIPLKMLGASYEPIKSAALKTQSIENCEFCEEVFLNKYDALIHNGKHIIIPLIKKDYFQCPLCLYYYTSRYKLKHHTRNKHKNAATEAANVKPIIQNNKIIIPVVKDNKVKPNLNDSKINLKVTNKSVSTVYKSDSGDFLPLVKHKKDTNKKVSFKCDSDSDDDLPLVNGALKKHTIKETENAPFESEILRQALLKDVKVVIEKIELAPEKCESKVNGDLKVPEKIEIDVKENQNLPIISEYGSVITHSSFDAIKSSNIGNSIQDNGKVKIRNRLTFEDDIDDICDDEVMKDLTKDCIVDMNLFDEPWFDEIANSITNDDVICVDDEDMVISIDDDVQEKSETESNEKKMDDVYTSTHHDELIKPGVYRCKKCQQMFPTRFNQIQHEMTHMHIRKPRPVLCEYCDRFLANKKTLKEHMESKHFMRYRPRTFKTCTKCGLKYSKYNTHLENYHMLLRCHLCNEGFEAEIDRLNHIRGHLVKIKCNQCDFVASELEIKEHQKRFHKVSMGSISTFDLCEICCLFLKNKQHMQYTFGDTVSKLGSRLDCEHCGNKFFHLTQVKRVMRGRPCDRFAFEKEGGKKKGLTNEDRLKNIQQRLKMINKLSRF